MAVTKKYCPDWLICDVQLSFQIPKDVLLAIASNPHNVNSWILVGQ